MAVVHVLFDGTAGPSMCLSAADWSEGRDILDGYVDAWGAQTLATSAHRMDQNSLRVRLILSGAVRGIPWPLCFVLALPQPSPHTPTGSRGFPLQCGWGGMTVPL